jgi:hypothetical protein
MYMSKAMEEKAMAAMEEYRQKYAEGTLSPRLIAKLEAIPGWTWTEDQEHPKDTRAFITDVRQRHAAGTLLQWKIERLERIPGWSW